MANVKIVTDSNSGISQAEAEKMGIYVLPMPFLIDGEQYFEDINLNHAQFFQRNFHCSILFGLYIHKYKLEIFEYLNHKSYIFKYYINGVITF